MQVYNVEVYDSGNVYWYQNGKAHRLDGPACEWSDGGKAWYIEDVEYTEEGFNQKIDEMNGDIVIVDGVKYKKVEE